MKITPLASRLDLPIQDMSELRERQLSNETIKDEDFFLAVEATWHDPLFSYPGGVTNSVAQLC